MQKILKSLNRHIIFFTPSNSIYQKSNQNNNLITQRLLLLKNIKNTNIQINITDMAKNPQNTIEIIKLYLNQGICPNRITTHIAARCRDRRETENFLNKLKDFKIKNILCVSGDMTGVPYRSTDTYSVYELIEIAREDFNISISAYPENLFNKSINENNIDYSEFNQDIVLNKKIRLLFYNQKEIKFFLQHSYNLNAIKKMINHINNISESYKINPIILPSVLPLFSPKYVSNISGINPVNNNMIDVPNIYIDLINKLNYAIAYNNKEDISKFNKILYQHTKDIINRISILTNGNFVIYNTNNYELMYELINDIKN